jgi:phosphatidylglycerol:prolipoprotein diacylglycerol transferase
MTLNIDPVLFNLGPLQVRWYGLMYVIGFVIAGLLGKKLSREKFFEVTEKQVDTFVTYTMVGIFLGARLIYCLVYNPSYYLRNPLEIPAIWHGGLSYHGAIIGLYFGVSLFAKNYRISNVQAFDVTALIGSQGIFFGRVGNFINGELWGKVTDVPWGIVFPGAGPNPRHPSQLYEAFLEGIAVFILVWALKKKVKIYGLICSSYLISYGAFRFLTEFFREPDVQMGYYLGFLTMGQILCVVMILGGAFLFYYSKKKNIPIRVNVSKKVKKS